MDKKPKRSWQDWEDIIFHKGVYVALAITLLFTVPLVVYFIVLLFIMFGVRAFLILFVIALLVSYIALSLKYLI